ncbi:MAG: hypothetical protein ACM37W_26140 [Actinomycetota bacterium]
MADRSTSQKKAIADSLKKLAIARTGVRSPPRKNQIKTPIRWVRYATVRGKEESQAGRALSLIPWKTAAFTFSRRFQSLIHEEGTV